MTPTAPNRNIQDSLGQTDLNPDIIRFRLGHREQWY